MNLLRILVITSLCLCSCAGQSAPIVEPLVDSPSNVVREFMRLANAGKSFDAAKLLDDGTSKFLEIFEALAPLINDWTKRGTVADFAVFREVIEGQKAVVYARIVYEDATTVENDRTLLVLRDGRWKITIYNPRREGK